MAKTFYEIKSNTWLSIKQPQPPELAHDCFRTVMSATSILNNNTSIRLFTNLEVEYLTATHTMDSSTIVNHDHF